MKLFIASDIHGCAVSTHNMLQRFEQSGAEYLILLGDILNHGPRNALPSGYDPIKVSELLNPYADRIMAVRGNCDSEVDQMLLQFPLMSDFNWVLLPTGQRLFLTHGHLYNKEKHPKLCAGDVIVSGHTHIPVAEMMDELYLFNPGSITIPRNGLPASYGLLEGNQLIVKTFDDEVLQQVCIA
ncbi:phosphodiesterase [Photobacterium damselae]|nr:phosphodiesterase [Photobacterium damselae]